MRKAKRKFMQSNLDLNVPVNTQWSNMNLFVYLRLRSSNIAAIKSNNGSAVDHPTITARKFNSFFS